MLPVSGNFTLQEMTDASKNGSGGNLYIKSTVKFWKRVDIIEHLSGPRFDDFSGLSLSIVTQFPTKSSNLGPKGYPMVQTLILKYLYIVCHDHYLTPHHLWPLQPAPRLLWGFSMQFILSSITCLARIILVFMVRILLRFLNFS